MKKLDYVFLACYIAFFAAVGWLVYLGMFDIWNREAPYIAGFFQFVVFATSGELLSTRILEKKWQINKYIVYKAFVWGVGGLIVTLAFNVISGGIGGAMENGLLPFANSRFARALFTSCFLNLFFAPIHAAVMRIFSNYGEERIFNRRRMTAKESIASVEWGEFIDFTYFKTAPTFWIPVNTLGFLLPQTLQVAFAAMLSFAFGMLMTVLKIRERKIQKGVA